jgi:pimeloyl-[acyl-carrier protein] methyl ester esterase
VKRAKMHFVLVHGWGFHAGLWAGFVKHLDGAEVTLVDLGFVAGGPEGEKSWPKDAIAVGHSLGLLWLLARGGGQFRALVSVQGFDCFCCHVPSSRVAAMRRGIERTPYTTVETFWRSSGAPDFAPPEALDIPRLHEGLDWLMQWDVREVKDALRCPMLALAARDDAIVPAAMSEAIWRKAGLVWSPDGGHVLPLRHPEWCARHVREFANSLPA